jgi:hypothetical protein
MAYELLLPYRKLAQEIPGTVLNTTHRLIITTFIEYYSEAKGVYVSFKTLAKELGLSKRALLENLHYLGDGQVWRDGKRVPCTNSKCKDHLKIIHGSHYARADKGQVYRLEFNNLQALATSVRITAPTTNPSVRLDVKEHAPMSESACATPHPYIPDIPDIRKKKTYDFVNAERWHVISQELPRLLVSQWRHTKESEACLDVILKGTSLKAFVADLRGHSFERAGDQTGVFMSHLRKCAGVNKPSKSLLTGEELHKELKEFAKFDLEAELKRFNANVDLDKTFKLPE